MENRKISNGRLTVFAAVSVFFIGGELLTVGRDGVTEAIGSGLAFLIALLFIPAVTGATTSAFGQRSGERRSMRILSALFGILGAAAALFVALDTTVKFSGFASDVMLLRAPRLPVALLFLAFCTTLALKGGRTVRKFAFLSTIMVGACALLFILLSLPSLDPRSISFEGADIDTAHTVKAFVKKFAPISVAPIYFSLVGGESDGDERLTPSSAFIGILIGGFILTVCHLNVTLLLGSALAREESLPYSAAIGAISTGKLFMRVEGLSYAMYFFSMASRLSIAVGTIAALSKRFLPLKRAVLSEVGRDAGNDAQITENNGGIT